MNDDSPMAGGVGDAHALELKKLLATSKAEQAKIAELAGGLGSLHKEFCEETSLHRSAVSFAARLHRMAPEKREDVLRSLDKVLAVMRPEWSGEVSGDLLGTLAGATEAPAETVTPIRRRRGEGTTLN